MQSNSTNHPADHRRRSEWLRNLGRHPTGPSHSADSTLRALLPDPRLIIYEMQRPKLTLQAYIDEQTNERTILCGDATHHVPPAYAAVLNDLTALELQRLQNELSSRNGLVVEHNPLLAAMLGCNTNVSLLGSAAQAKAIH